MIICAQCHVLMRPATIGVKYLECTDNGSQRVWATDEYKCPECDYRVAVTDKNQAAFIQKHEPMFESYVMQNKIKRFWLDKPKEKEK